MSENNGKEKRVKRYYLEEEWINYIEEYKDVRNIHYESNAVQIMLNEHKNWSNNIFDLRFIVDELKKELLLEISNAVAKNVAEELQRVRLGTNNTDRNTQILIELLQGLMFDQNIQVIATTDEFKPDFLSQAEQVVHERIINLKEKKHSKNTKSEKGE